ncbi:Bardet-Biedl syndrome 2 protein homolog, partial [Geodia barretti]
RRSKTGEVVYKDSFGSHVAGIVQADYRGDGNVELICCSVDGEVRGYLSASTVQPGGVGGAGREEWAGQDHWKQLESLAQRKQNLLLELRNFEASEKVSRSKDPLSEISQGGQPMGVIPAGTLLRTEFSAFLPDGGGGGGGGGGKLAPHIELSVEATNDTVIRAVVIFAEGLFEGESHIITQFHVFEATRRLPQFSLYIPCPLATEPHPQGRVAFNVPERLETVTGWLNDSFMYGAGEDSVLTPYLHVAFLSLRSSFPLILSFKPAQNGAFTIETDDLDLAGDIIQSLASYVGLTDLSVTASFPQQMKELRDVLEEVEELHKIRQKLSAEMADNSALIRNLVVRAEDARIMNDMGNMKKAYFQLYELNKDLMLGYNIRSNNHLELLECLRIVNQAIQKTGNLRVGKPKAQLIAACRAAIKNKDNDTLIKTMMNGAS